MEEEIRRAADLDTLVIYREFLDLNYFRDSAYRPILNGFLRDKYKQSARELLVGLRNDFPQNPMFGKEIARIDGGD